MCVIGIITSLGSLSSVIFFSKQPQGTVIGRRVWLKRVSYAGQPADLGMHVILVHGDEVIADSEQSGSIQAATAQYKQWLNMAS